jgi:hypothetical protein
MKKIYLILIIGVILTLLLHRCKEHFNNIYHEYKSVTDKSPPSYESDLSFTSSPTMNCCLITKEYVEDLDPSSLYQGTFVHKYKKLSDDKCNMNLYKLDSNKQLFIEGDNNWSNLSCNDTTQQKEPFDNNYAKILMESDLDQNTPIITQPPKAQILGSCRFANKECFDYVDKKFCDRFNMDWSPKTCNEMIEYKFIDKVKNHIPTFDYEDSVINMFPQPGV